MIDFKRNMKLHSVDKSKNPLDIYNTLDRQSNVGPLRESQISALSEWYENRLSDRDVVIKLHTGEGKTLIGLLALMTKLNQGEGPCVYVCPNKYLVKQVWDEATKFGIPVCLIGEKNVLPSSFNNCERILITHVQKMFNGRSIFGLGSQSKKTCAVVLDDAHACLDAIRDAFTIKISRLNDGNLYDKILSLFEYDLANQREGTLWDIKNNGDYESMMLIPYWSWNEKKEDVLRMLGENKGKIKSIEFSWPLLKDRIPQCQAYISGREIQIIPFATPIDEFGSFSRAEQRILMSATTQDDIFFVKNLGVSIEAIKNPVINKKSRWSGEKMILIPELISDEFTREKMIYEFSRRNHNGYGVVSLTPTKKKQDAYREYGCILIDSDNVFKELDSLKSNKSGRVRVFANRYDGIDLPDNECRILIMDSLPFSSNMGDRYEESARPENVLINKKACPKNRTGTWTKRKGRKRL